VFNYIVGTNKIHYSA